MYVFVCVCVFVMNSSWTLSGVNSSSLLCYSSAKLVVERVAMFIELPSCTVLSYVSGAV